MDPGKEEQENEEKMEFTPGVLSQLLSLERRDRAGALQREQRERGQEHLELLRGRARELRLRRDRLTDRLHTLAAGKSGIPWDPREVLQWRIRELRELLSLFPLTGVCGKLSRQGLSLSLHTSFEGSLLDSFHLELQECQEPSQEPSQESQESQESQKSRESRERRRGWRLGRHSVPPFIPLQRLARQFLPGNPRGFLGELGRHLSACAARREQSRIMQEEFSEFIQGTPCSNSLCNLLSFHCRIPRKIPKIPGKNTPKIPGKNPKIPGKSSEIPGKSSGNVLEFRARLLYGDPLRSLPTDVEISAQGAVPAPFLQDLFQSHSLPRALRKLLEFPAGSG